MKSSSLRVLLVGPGPSSPFVLLLKAIIWTELQFFNHLTYNFDTKIHFITKVEFNCIGGISLYRWYFTMYVVCKYIRGVFHYVGGLVVPKLLDWLKLHFITAGRMFDDLMKEEQPENKSTYWDTVG